MIIDATPDRFMKLCLHLEDEHRKFLKESKKLNIPSNWLSFLGLFDVESYLSITGRDS